MLFYKTQTKTNKLHSVIQGIPFNSPPEPLLAVVEMAKRVGWTLAYLGKTLRLDNKKKSCHWMTTASCSICYYFIYTAGRALSLSPPPSFSRNNL